MSAQLQRYRDKRHEVSDDLESFLHVLDWCTYTFLPHELSERPEALVHLIHSRYDEYLIVPSADGHGVVYEPTHSKVVAAESMVNIVAGLPWDHPFTWMLDKLHALCGKHYAINRPPSPAVESSPDPDPMYESVMKSLLPRLIQRYGHSLSHPTREDIFSSPSPAVPVPAETLSPLRDHTLFKDTIFTALTTKGVWLLMKKDVTQARLLERTTSTPLVDSAESNWTIDSDSVDSDESRPHKRQKSTASVTSDNEQDGDQQGDGEDDFFGPLRSEHSAHDSAAEDVVVGAAESAEAALTRSLNLIGIRGPRRKTRTTGKEQY